MSSRPGVAPAGGSEAAAAAAAVELTVRLFAALEMVLARFAAVDTAVAGIAASVDEAFAVANLRIADLADRLAVVERAEP